MWVPMLRGYSGKNLADHLAGLAAELALLGYQPLWRDEAFTALAVQRPLGSMLDVVRNDSAPPLFYLWSGSSRWCRQVPAVLRLLPSPARHRRDPDLAALGRRVAGDAGGSGRR